VKNGKDMSEEKKSTSTKAARKILISQARPESENLPISI
jgi:hypothetical protein